MTRHSILYPQSVQTTCNDRRRTGSSRRRPFRYGALTPFSTSTSGYSARVDLLAVDAEGLDYEVLLSNDWNRYRPRLVLIAILGVPTIKAVKESRECQFLESEGYELIAKMANSTLFVDRSPPRRGGPSIHA